MKFYEKDQTRYAVILAGGDGRRLSEVTRRITGDVTPKQFCPVIGNVSLLEQTRLRVSLAVDEDRILTVLTRSHERHYRDLFKEIPPRTWLFSQRTEEPHPQSCMHFCDCPKPRASHAWCCFRRIISGAPMTLVE